MGKTEERRLGQTVEVERSHARFWMGGAHHRFDNVRVSPLFPQAGLQRQREGSVPTNACFRVPLVHRSHTDFVLGFTVLRQCIGERAVDGSYSGTRTKLADGLWVKLLFRAPQSYESHVSVFVFTCIVWTDIYISL